jgi:hypothetical protein
MFYNLPLISLKKNYNEVIINSLDAIPCQKTTKACSLSIKFLK